MRECCAKIAKEGQKYKNFNEKKKNYGNSRHTVVAQLVSVQFTMMMMLLFIDDDCECLHRK